MRKLYLSIGLSLVLAALAESQALGIERITIIPREVHRILTVHRSQAFIPDGPAPDSLLPMLSVKGEWLIYERASRVRVFDSSFVEIGSFPFDMDQIGATGSSVESTRIGTTWSRDDLIIRRINERLVEIRIPNARDSDERPVVIWNDILLMRNAQNFTYKGYLIHDDGSYEALSQAEVFSSLIAESSAFNERDSVLYYGLVPLQTSFRAVDDDNNFYTTGSIHLGNGEVYLYEVVGKPGLTYFDSEGNCWQIAWSDDKAGNPIFYYAGRDWGYRESPKKAVATDSGLRIRLRATTDAFVLGAMAKDQAITILKTGETVTIGGITAPWYRIKTADGLIGWAFGGYIKVLE